MRRPEPLWAAAELLRPRWPRLLLAGLLGALSLYSALALAGISAWLITRAWQMPLVLDLSIAVVAVRACAVSRGVLHYCERLLSHDVALRAAGSARTQLYRRLAGGPVDAAMRLHRGELVARAGTDVDELAEVLVRALLPIAIAVVLGVTATAVIATISPVAAAVLAVCLLVAGAIAPWLAARAAAAQEETARDQLVHRDVAAMLALDHAPELRIAGLLPGVIAESGYRQRAWGAALDAAAKPAAVAAALPTAATGFSVLGAVVAGIAIADSVAPTTLAVLMLLPLAAFEASTALPGAAVSLVRSRIAARRLLDLAPTAPRPPSDPAPPGAETAVPARLYAEVRSGYHRSHSVPVTVDLAPGDRLAITGPSGAGKSALLMTLAGLLTPLAGRVEIGGRALAELGGQAGNAGDAENQVRQAIGFFAEDAHLFATTVRDNLLVARGDCSDDELTATLRQVGLGSWLAGLPDGLDTVLAGGAAGVSAGQRRRLLLARALISPARIVLLDEPTEHLDAGDAGELLRALLEAPGLFGADRTVVVATHQLPAESSCRHLAIGQEVSSDAAAR
ncbi:thiol reductant ABC exporter subunit CydC [Mycolicibacter minnesotensis]